jgi:hypothetical protein
VGASSSALPGENLYPVKLTWENVRLFFTFNEEYRETLEHAFENERLHEVNELFVERRDATIRFSGVYTTVNGVAYVSGIHIVILNTSTLPAEPLINGVAVAVTGHTNAQKFVDVESIKLLPTGSIVPTGEPPVGIETEREGNGIDNKKENSNVNEKGIVNGNDHGNDGIGNSNDNSNESNSGGDGINPNNNGDGGDGIGRIPNGNNNDGGSDGGNGGGGGNDSGGGGNDGGGSSDNSGSDGGGHD